MLHRLLWRWMQDVRLQCPMQLLRVGSSTWEQPRAVPDRWKYVEWM